jgi:redox-sensitive bicupin YhaK (pirin superfamily)
MLGDRTLVRYSDGDEVGISAGDAGVRFLLISGKPLGEAIAWRGPIVMNTQDELREAYRELHEGTFIKHG